MKRIFLPIFRSVLKRRETQIFLWMSLSPLLYLLSTYLKTRLFSFAGPVGVKIAFFDFFYGQFNLQFSSVISSMALAFVAISIFRTEINQHILFLYKDIDKRNIFLAKLGSLLSLISLYCGNYFLTSILVYYFRVAHLPYGSFRFWSDDFNYSILATISIFVAYIIVALVASTASLFFQNGLVLALILLLNLMMSLAQFIPNVSYLFPQGYVGVLENQFLLVGVLVMFGLTLCYVFVCFSIGIRKFQKLEF